MYLVSLLVSKIMSGNERLRREESRRVLILHSTYSTYVLLERTKSHREARSQNLLFGRVMRQSSRRKEAMMLVELGNSRPSVISDA
jgi:hypothetical protein